VTGIGFGTWSWGNQLLWGYRPERDDPDLKATFSAAVAAGLHLVDTADSYGTGHLNGRSEALLGQFLAEMEPSACQQMIVATKLAPFPWRLGRRGLLKAFEASRQRLQGRLDRVQLHWSTARYAPWQELPLLDGLADLVERGEVHELGLSNVGPRRLGVLHRRLAQRGIKLASVQVQFSLLAPEPSQPGGILEVSRDLGVEVLAYSPLALGILARPPGWAPQRDTALRSSLYRRLLPGSEALRQAMAAIGAARGVTQMQVALNWCRSHGASPIPGFRRPCQVIDASQALNWTLTEEERGQLDQLSVESAVRMPNNPFQSA
tara:strand:- start:2083 stop:3042 length:960 start_codon:yes stop_codon:yes gene_type:complete